MSESTNIRKAVRDYFVALCKTPSEVDGASVYPTQAADRVYPNRSLPLECDLLPALLVYVAKDRRGEPAFNGTYYRVLDLVVEWRDAGDDTLHDSLDDAAWTVEQLFLLDNSLGGLVDDRPERSFFDSLELAEDASTGQVIGAGLLRFHLEYIAPPRAEVSSLDDLLKIRGSIDIAPADKTIDLSLAVDFPPPEED